MPRVSDLRDELDKRVGELEKIQKEADKRSDKKLTQDEIKRFKELDAEIRDYQEQIEVAERAEKLLTSRQSDAEDKEDRSRKPAGANVTNMRDLEAEKPFESFGKQLRAIMAAGRPGAVVDKRLLYINEQQQRAASGSNESVLAEGGFLVQKSFGKEILSRSYETGKLIGRLAKLNLDPGTNGIKIPVVKETSRATGSRWGGLRCYWKGEAAQLEKSKPEFRMVELELKKLTGLWYVTDELLKDASVMESIAMQGFSSEFGFMLDNAAIAGGGAYDPKGFTNSGALVVVAKEAGQAAATINVANLAKMEARLFDASDRSAIWVAHKSTKAQLMQLTIGNVPVYISNVKEKANFDFLLGRPIVYMEQCETLGTQNDIMLVDPNEILSIQQNEMEVASSIHVQFVYDESVFRFIHRFDCQPTLNKAVDPFKGTDKESAFVTLATRA